jgi:hypothetical protein
MNKTDCGDEGASGAIPGIAAVDPETHVGGVIGEQSALADFLYLSLPPNSLCLRLL